LYHRIFCVLKKNDLTMLRQMLINILPFSCWIINRKRREKKYSIIDEKIVYQWYHLIIFFRSIFYLFKSRDGGWLFVFFENRIKSI
jgi:hypothetical protein